VSRDSAFAQISVLACVRVRDRLKLICAATVAGVCLSMLSALVSAQAQGTDQRTQEQEQAQTKAKLQHVRAEIERESLARNAVQAEHVTANAALREIELAVGAAARTVAHTDTELAQRERALLDLEAEREALESRLAGQRLKLASLLRSAYQLGRNQHLRSWLARDQLHDSARLVAYNRYLQTHRMNRMRGLLDELGALIAVTQDIQSAKTQLTARRVSGQAEIDLLTTHRAERQQLINKLSAQLADHRQRLRAYARDEKSLLDLLERLQDVLTDIPRQISDALPLVQLRGRLPWPLQGRIVTAFGTTLGPGRTADGIVIAAATGTEVMAIAHGRVAYADWLRGFGLLIIVDHGDGYMSLYANNEALLRDEGDWVQAGTALARAGSSGGAEQSGLYFELRKNSQPLNPNLWLRKP